MQVYITLWSFKYLNYAFPNIGKALKLKIKLNEILFCYEVWRTFVIYYTYH